MKLLRLHVENFGTLQNFRMELSNGLNTLYRENGWGKSTLAVFIKAMFYGLPATSKRSLDENERKKYMPWQGGAYGGSLEFETARGRFRIERFFAPKESGDSVTLYDLSTNKPTEAYRDPFGEELFGIDAEGFERTVYLSQRPTFKGDNSSITAKLGNLLDDVDDIGSYDDAWAALEKRRQFYVKTGNRGHIAELEQMRAEKQRDLEALWRVRDTLAQKESDYDVRMRELTANREELKKVRVDLGKAGLLRERSAHEEEKSRMLRELEDLDKRRRDAENALDGKHPTTEELQQAHAHLDALRDAKAKLNAISAEPVTREPLRILPERMAESVPKKELIDSMLQSNSRLESACQREAVLLSTQSNAAWRRFVGGAPAQTQIDAAYAALRDAQNEEREAEKCAAQESVGRAPVLSILLFSIGAILAALGFLPMLTGFLPFGLIGAALCAIGAVIALVRHSAAQKRILREREDRATAHRQKARTLMGSVKGFLARYGMDGSDPMRQLSELSVLVRRFEEEQEALARAGNEKQTLAATKRQEYAFLIPSLRLFGIERGEQESFYKELDALREDVNMLERVRSLEEERRRKRADAENEYRVCQNRIKPFLDRFDPRREDASALECLRRVEYQENEWRRANDEYRHKDDALRRFIRDKKLDEQTETDYASLNYGALSKRERDLQERIELLQNETSRLEQEINHLATDADRIADAEAGVAQLEEALKEAKENSETVANTMRFLEEAKTSLSTRYLSDMQKSFSRFLSTLISGEAPESVMDTSFEISLREGGKTRTMESFSRGWRDAVQFCTRLSLTAALYAEGEKPFLLLDDPFVNLDDRRLSAARHLLDTLAREYQIIYMVCHADRG